MDPNPLVGQRLAQRLRVHLRTVDGCRYPIPAQLSYDTRDPYALTVCFQLNDTSVPWTFARDLLSDGLITPVGNGDVHVSPRLDEEGRPIVTIELRSPHGEALVEVHRTDAVDFLERSYAAVAPGAEPAADQDLDTIINNIRPETS